MENHIKISGVYGTKTKYQSRGEKFISTLLTSTRKSGVEDECKLVLSEVLDKELEGYDKILVEGTIRTRKINLPNKKNECYIMADKIEPYYQDDDVNEVILNGELAIDPKLRHTNASKKTIADCPVITHRNNGRQDVIPCVTWGRIAQTASCLEAGAKIIIQGRLQSRVYTKNGEEYLVNEVSANKMNY